MSHWTACALSFKGYTIQGDPHTTLQYVYLPRSHFAIIKMGMACVFSGVLQNVQEGLPMKNPYWFNVPLHKF